MEWSTELMTLYIVIEGEYETAVEGVFSTFDLAEAYIKSQKKAYPRCRYSIGFATLDQPIE